MQPAPLSVLGAHAVLNVDGLGVPFFVARELHLQFPHILRVRERLPRVDARGQFLGRVAEHRPELPRKRHVTRSDVVLPDRELGRFERALQPLLAQAQRRVRAAKLALLRRRSQRTLYRRHEPLQTRLQHVIGRAGLQAFDGFVFAQRAGDDYHGRIGLMLARSLERGEAVVIEEVVIAHDEIEALARDRCFVIGASAHPQQIARCTLGGERVLDQLRIVCVVFEVQHADPHALFVTHANAITQTEKRTRVDVRKNLTVNYDEACTLTQTSFVRRSHESSDR